MKTPCPPASIRRLHTIFLALLAVFVFGSREESRAQQLQPGQKIDPSILEWPRFYTTNGYDFAIYQPQISQWPGNQLDGRLVIAVRPSGTSNETYGVIFFTTRTDIDKVNRLVTLEDFQITKADFPSQPGMKLQYLAMIQSFQPQTIKVIPLDHLEAVFAASADIAKAKVQSVKNDPPKIIYATTPSLLVLVDGPPILKELTGDYLRVVNTRAILLLDKNPYFQNYYLYADSQWFTAPALGGPWTISLNLPPGIDVALSAALATKQVDPMYPKNTSAPTVTQVFVSSVPAELIESTGPANLLSVANTDLLYVDNSSNAIFYYLDDGKYYVLVSGRWFRSPALTGPWAFVPPGSLPSDFKKIPADNAKSNVMLSVPGTPQAQEAVIANSIPQTASVQRDQAKLAVVYLGGPSFVPIAGTTLSYAANTDTPVIMAGPNSYYACQAGLWFAAVTPAGPWVVATSVPPVIYTIPANCPIHYVTYAYIYGYTPTVVYVGYTPGYMGTVVAPGGVVVYGTGYYYPPVVVGTTYVSYPPTYGYGASFALGAAVGFAFGYCAGSSSSCACEPHWGCYSTAYYSSSSYSYSHVNVNSCNYYTHYGTAVSSSSIHGYNAYTGTSYSGHTASTFNPYTGTKGTVSGGAAYNPYTGNAAAAQSGTWHNPYSGATATANRSVSGNAYTGKYTGSSSSSGYNPSTGGSYSGSGSGNYNANNGNYNANKSGSYNNAQTGESASAQKSVSGNVYNGTKNVSTSGSAQNSKTGNSASWSNGSMTSDKNGNTYNYNQGDSSQNKSTAQSENAASQSSRQSSWGGSSSSAQSSWASKESSAQATGSQRFSGWSGSGGGGWGGSRSGGGGFRR
jgi:hypothetical protein